jgi:hypothetical protein
MTSRVEVHFPEADALRWIGLFRMGAIAAWIIAGLLVGEIVVFAVFSRPGSALEHFELFQSNALAGLLTLDLLGLVAYLLFIPTILALYVALRRSAEALMAVAVALFFVGVADFFATNTAFPVLTLSQQYAAATTDADRAAVLAAGEAMFALFNENAFLVSYLLVSAAWTMIGVVMLRNGAFGRASAYTGIMAGGMGIVAVILEHISEVLVPAAIPLYFAAIVFLLAWVLLVGGRLHQVAASTKASSRVAAV